MATRLTFYDHEGVAVREVTDETKVPDGAMAQAVLIVGSVNGTERVLKYRYGSLNTPVADALARLRRG